METGYNSMTFTPKEVEDGLAREAIGFIMSLSAKSDTHMAELAVTTDGYCTTVKWIWVPYDRSYGGKFEFVDDGEEVMREVELPDGSWSYIGKNDDQEAYIGDWLSRNPGWHRDSHGRWERTEDSK